MSSEATLKSMLKTRFAGALVGAAIGDALGFPYEASSRSFLYAIGDEITDSFAKHRSGYFDHGQFSDESQFMLATVESLLTAESFDAEQLAQACAELWRENRVIGRDAESDAAMKRLLSGVPWNECGSEDGYGNGALSRAVPLGLWYHDRPEKLVAATTAAAELTHRHPIAIACSVATASAVAYCVTHREIILGDFLDQISAAAGEVEPSVAKMLREFTGMLARPEPAVLSDLTDLGHDSDRIPEGVSSDSRSTLMTALYYFLRAPSDVIGALRGCLLSVCDVDSTAFVAGALAGAFNGEAGLPTQLRDTLVEGDRVTHLASELYALRCRSRG